MDNGVRIAKELVAIARGLLASGEDDEKCWLKLKRLVDRSNGKYKCSRGVGPKWFISDTGCDERYVVVQPLKSRYGLLDQYSVEMQHHPGTAARFYDFDGALSYAWELIISKQGKCF